MVSKNLKRSQRATRIVIVVLLALVLGTATLAPAPGAPSRSGPPNHARSPGVLGIGRLQAPPRPPVTRPAPHTVVAPPPGPATSPQAPGGGGSGAQAPAATSGPQPAEPPSAGATDQAGSTAGSTADSTADSAADPTAATTSGSAPQAAVAAAALPTGATTGTGLASGKQTLIVYDDGGGWGWLGELYGQQIANLVSHFGSWAAVPVSSYTSGLVADYDAVVYAGSTYDQAMPAAFLTDVSSTTKPVIWMYDNIWQLMAADPTFSTRNGWTYRQFDFSSVGSVAYKGKDLFRYANNAAGIMDVTVSDPAKAQVLATAKRADGSTFPWAVRSGNFTYIGEIPFAYVDHGDRYLAFSDLLFDALAPGTATRHRALVRIEDVGPDADPAELRAVADYLSRQSVPFSVAVYSRYVDPKGVYNGGAAEDYTLASRPTVVKALKYMQSKGGTLLMHGYTHQYGTEPNPYDGVSGNDFEFYTAHIDANNNVVYDGPVPEDSPAWATGRIESGVQALKTAGLAVPSIFEFPHYAGSAVDYRAVADRFTTRYDRGLYFGGLWAGGAANYQRLNGQYFPYVVRDLYGTKVVPENVGNVEPEPFNNHPARLPADLVRTAEQNLVVRDGFASFFYHPYLGTTYLRTTIEGIKGLGYKFVAAPGL